MAPTPHSLGLDRQYRWRWVSQGGSPVAVRKHIQQVVVDVYYHVSNMSRGTSDHNMIVTDIRTKKPAIVEHDTLKRTRRDFVEENKTKRKLKI